MEAKFMKQDLSQYTCCHCV